MFKIEATIRWDGFTQHYGPYSTRAEAEQRAAALYREAKRNAPLLSPETNAAFNVCIYEVSA